MVALAGVGLATLACSGADRSRRLPAVSVSEAAESPIAADTIALTREMLAQGDSIFHGQAGGGTCFQCHGRGGGGTSVAPNLSDGAWDNGDGSYPFIVRTVRDGVPPHPEHGRAGMPAMGGVPLSPEQIRSVAAYVYARSHRSPAT